MILPSLAAAHFVVAADVSTLWSTKVQPILDVNCVKCHGPLQQKGGLELDTLEMLNKGGDDGKIIVPGKPDASRLFENLAAEADPHMPPKKQLTEAEMAAVREWIAAMKEVPAAAAPAPKVEHHFNTPTEAIDTLLTEGWTQRGVLPAAPVDDRTWCRRAYLDLAGRIPTTTELDNFLQAPSETRRSALVDRLLSSEEYAVHLRELWDVFLMGRQKRDRNEDPRKKNGWYGFLENAFRTNRPWNETVQAILVARPEKPEDIGASWFIYERRNNHQAIGEAVAPLIYGTKIDCAQCHDHPLAREIKQAHYWGLVAAYNRGKNVEGGSAISESAIGGFVNFTNLKKESQPAIVTLLTGALIKEDRPAEDQKEEDGDDKYVDPKAKTKVPKFSRRAAFAEAATHDNPLLAKAFVNRMWAAYLGRGIVTPVDQMNARNAPSHPELLDWLAADFATHHYDVRHVIRGIVLSRAYALGLGDGPPEFFNHELERPLTAEQLARSWRVVAGLPPEDEALRRAAVTAVPDVLPGDYNANYQQAQFLANSPAVSAILKPDQGGAVRRISKLSDAESKVREAFLAAYERAPDAEEAEQAGKLLTSNPDQAAATRDLLWALMTSAEFLTTP